MPKKNSKEKALEILKADLEAATNSIEVHQQQLLMLRGICSYITQKINDADKIKP